MRTYETRHGYVTVDDLGRRVMVPHDAAPSRRWRAVGVLIVVAGAAGAYLAASWGWLS